MRIVLPVKPRTHTETRWNPKGFAYKTREAKEYASLLEAAIDAALEEGYVPTEHPLAVSLDISKDSIIIDVTEWHYFSKVRGDSDNYAKPILDAGNKRIWNDDSQIQQLTVTKW